MVLTFYYTGDFSETYLMQTWHFKDFSGLYTIHLSKSPKVKRDINCEINLGETDTTTSHTSKFTLITLDHINKYKEYKIDRQI